MLEIQKLLVNIYFDVIVVCHEKHCISDFCLEFIVVVEGGGPSRLLLLSSKPQEKSQMKINHIVAPAF